MRMGVTSMLLCWVYLIAIVSKEASGTSMTISPPSITIGLGSATVPLTFECKPSSLPGKTIGSIPVMKISMQRGNNAEVGIVSISTGVSAAYTPDVLTDIRDRSEISGNLVSPGTGVSEQDIIGGSYVKFTMNQTQVRCNDAAMFKCSITYIGSLFDSTKDVASANLTTKALPVSLMLTARRNNNAAVGGDSSTNKAEFNVGDIARFSCIGDIGSDKNLKIKWRMSDIATGAMSSHTDGVEDGVINSAPINCQYSLTSHMTYNITTLDVTRTTDMRVQCYLDVTSGNDVESNMYYINPYDPSVKDTYTTVGSTTTERTTKRPAAADSSSTSVTVAILGAVVGVQAVVILILGVCLWNERRHKAGTDKSSGVTYVNALDTVGPGNNQRRPGTNPVSPGPAPEGSYQQLDMATRAGNTAASEYEQLEGRQYESVR